MIRGTPLLLQLIYIYYVLPEIGIRLDAFTAAVIGLTLNYAAYISEVYRAGIQAIAKGQSDAAAALGMTRGLALRRIILPQAIRLVIPALGNYLISLFKDTALCSVVSVQEVLFTAQIMAARNYQYFTLYTVVGVFYFAVGFPAARLVDWLERRTRQGYRRRRRPHEPRRPWSRSTGPAQILRPLEVIKGVSLSVDQGEVVCVIGPSGSGKSTFLRCLNWLEVPERGLIRIDGEPAFRELADGVPRLQPPRRIAADPRQDRHGVPGLQPVPAHDGARERHGGAAPRAAACRRPRRGRAPRRCCARSALSTAPTTIPRSSPAASSSASPSPARWRWSPRRCCSTRSRARSTPSWSARCWP